MSDVRLNGLSMLNIHRHIDINQVIDSIARKKEEDGIERLVEMTKK